MVISIYHTNVEDGKVPLKVLLEYKTNPFRIGEKISVEPY
jgi:hypothetical protein